MTVVIDKNKLGEWQYAVEDTKGTIVKSGFNTYEEAKRFTFKK